MEILPQICFLKWNLVIGGVHNSEKLHRRNISFKYVNYVFNTNHRCITLTWACLCGEGVHF